MTKKTTDIATTESTELAKPAEPIEGYEGLGVDDFAPPYVKLLQGTSDEVKDGNAEPGQFTDGAEFFSSIRLVVVHQHKERDLYDPNTGDKCKSHDTIVPSSAIERPFADTCAECPKKDWVNKKRECADVYAVTAVNVETGAPFKISFKKTSFGPFRGLLGQMNSKKVPLFGCSVLMSSQKKSSGNNSWFVPKFSEYEVLEDSSQYRELYLACLNGGAKGSSDDGGEDVPF